MPALERTPRDEPRFQWLRPGLVLAFAALFWGHAGDAIAFEFFDDRLQVHGFYETQIRAIARDFDASDDWDLTQWANILNIEIEADIAPDGWGPFDLLSAFGRIEVRYDCVWTRGCGMLSSADTYGDRAKRLPGRVGDGGRAGFRQTGTLFNEDVRRFANIPREFLGYEFFDRPDSSPKASKIFDVSGIDTLFGVAGVDGIFGSSDDPAPFVFDEVLDNCLFGFRDIKGPENGVGSQVLAWNPGCETHETGRLSSKPHPLRAGDLNPVVLGPGNGGFGELPLRPVPRFENTDIAPSDQAKGIYLPNSRFAQMLRDKDFHSTDQDFRQSELAWNHGASQQGERELKELYLDMEFFDSRLWVRGGLQSIVWGKTELFRTTDQFNPQDLALASLPSLEESRVALWSVRGVWSFYTVGPLEDVRLELATNIDEFEPADLGRCGEPYAPLPVCNKTTGLFAHGLTGIGLAGEVRPEDPWDDSTGWEIGARLEFRWDRFSIAITDFYGYNDLPYQERLFTYSRNVDPTTGAPRLGMATGPCSGAVDGDFSNLDPSCLTPDNALEFHAVNQQIFAMICATSVGLLPDLDPTACGQTIFNSPINVFTGNPAPDPSQEATVAGLVSNLVAGNQGANIVAQVGLTFGVPIPHLELSQDPCDGFLADCTTSGNPSNPFYSSGGRFPTLNTLTTVQQQALLGCGPLYGTDCEADGIDLMNAEASSIMQSWPGFEGAGGIAWDTTDPDVVQPGTLGFQGGPVCTRFEDGLLRILPGCRGPTYQTGTLMGGVPVMDSDYDVSVDGDPTGLVQPFFDPDPANPFYRGVPSPFSQQFVTEMGAASFNTLMALVALSSPPDENDDGIPDSIAITDFDPDAPYRDDGCSFARPTFCSNVQSIYQVTGVQRNTVNAAGNGNFGRRDFVWQGGTPLVLHYEKRNVLGFSMDWAEDVTKTNWGFELTWIEGLPFTDLDEADRLREADTYNLTISMDRPTFISFLNPNRTFFLNTQVFLQYVDGYRRGFSSNGPWNTLVTFTVQTGFFRDRFLPNMTFVWDFRSNSGAWLPSVQYRYTENFSVTFGVALFSGRMQSRRMALSPTALSNRAGSGRGNDYVENGLSVVRERDEVFLKIRYTF